MRLTRPASLLLPVLLLLAVPAGGAAPARVVSINLCADLLLLTLLPRERIVSLSPYAADPDRSPLAAQARGIDVNHGRVEEIVELRPDLVLAGRFNSPETLALLRRLDVPLLVLDVPSSFEQTRAQIRELGRALDASRQAEQAIDAMDARLAYAARRLPADRPAPLAAVYRANGYTAGAGTLVGSRQPRRAGGRAGLGNAGPGDAAAGRAVAAGTRRGRRPSLARQPEPAPSRTAQPHARHRGRVRTGQPVDLRRPVDRAGGAAARGRAGPFAGDAVSRPRPAAVLALLAVLVALLFAASLASGRAVLPLLSLALEGGERDATLWLILTSIRLPRAVLAVLVGASLGLAGAALQGYLRNPLAEPALVGASSTGALGAVLVLYTGLSLQYPLALPLGGMAGAAVGMALVALLGGRDGVLGLILAGVAVNSLAGALTSLALNLAPSPFASLEIAFWLLGSLADRSADHVWVALPFMLAGGLMLLSLSRALDALTLGEETAASLGVHLGRTRLLVVLGVGLCVGACVAVSGVIGFVGLVVPHLLRPLAGHRPGALLLPSALGGAALLLAADIAARALSGGGGELKLGVVTALVGAPFFLHLLVRLRGQLA